MEEIQEEVKIEETIENKENKLENLTNIPKTQNPTYPIAGAILLAGVLIAGAILLKDGRPSVNTNTQPKAANTQDLANVAVNPITDKDHITGNKNAKVVVVEYSDTECPFCKVFHQTMQKILKDKSVDIAWVYRHNPIPQLHSKAVHEAEATECAFEQGGDEVFWKYIDRVFEVTTSNNGLDPKELMNIADYAGLNSSSFYTCLQSGKYTNQIEKAMEDGAKAGVNGTPTSFILVNGKVVDIIQGAQPYETVLAKLKALK